MKKFNLKNISREIKGSRVVLKKLNPTFKDAQLYLDLILKNRDFFDEYMFFVRNIKTVEDSYAVIKDYENDFENGESVIYGIFLDNNLIGRICTFESNINGNLGYMLGKDFNGKGYMTESLKLFENELFKLGAERIQIQYKVGNNASAKIAEKCGYKVEGILRKYEYVEINKEYIDKVVTSKLKSEWIKEG